MRVIPEEIKFIVDAIEDDTFIPVIYEEALLLLEESKQYYDKLFGSVGDFFDNYDWYNEDDDGMISAVLAANKTTNRFIKGVQKVIDAFYLAIERGEKRKDPDFRKKKSKYLGLIGMHERGKAYYVASLIAIPSDVASKQ